MKLLLKSIKLTKDSFLEVLQNANPIKEENSKQLIENSKNLENNDSK